MIKKILKFSKSPILLYSSYFITLISFLLAIYFYLESKREREPYFISSNYNEPILKNYRIDSEEDLGLKIILKTDKKNKFIQGDIYSSKVFFWNNGKESIKNENILQKLKIYPKGDSQILGVRILKESRLEITKFNINLNKISNEIYLSFRILEQNDGATIQIIYNGEESEKFLIKGIIESVREINLSNKYSETISLTLSILYTTGGLIIFLILFAISIFLLHNLFLKIYKILFLLTKWNFFSDLIQKEKDDPGRFISILGIFLLFYAIYFTSKQISVNSIDIPKEIIVERINGV
ncbi:hypothetical protein [Leptospira levettii]|uniref:Uncharacterized protein n=1 Tax=Leptospira levettii TaxID=2023178 RepID=A0AAW5VBP9_9LEPT|nr:hypothetical protein [Leptospira levettii]MCW7467822.1 hypothetical protein [Leptospira levettii]MCW7513453.1 hypothetical protein [Leptospira levettii]MCW7517216.1 hypothetical protein [Leptospira levettii]